jgi:hypothetical protein
MPVDGASSLETEIVLFLKGFSGKKVIELNHFLSRDVGIYGGDGVQILYELEDKFGVNLQPLIDANTVFQSPNWFDRLRGRKHGPPIADLTVKQLIDYIVSERTK